MDLFLNYYHVYISLRSIKNFKQNRCEHDMQFHVCWIDDVCGGLAMCVMIYDCALRVYTLWSVKILEQWNYNEYISEIISLLCGT